MGVPNNGWFIRGNPIKMDDWGVSLFQEHTYIHTYIHIYIYTYHIYIYNHLHSHLSIIHVNTYMLQIWQMETYVTTHSHLYSIELYRDVKWIYDSQRWKHIDGSTNCLDWYLNLLLRQNVHSPACFFFFWGGAYIKDLPCSVFFFGFCDLESETTGMILYPFDGGYGKN